MNSLSRFLYPAAFTFLPPLSIFSLNYVLLLYCHENEIDVGQLLQGVDTESNISLMMLGGSWIFATSCFGYGAYMLWREGGASRNSLPLRIYAAQLIITHMQTLLKLSAGFNVLRLHLLGALTVFGTTLLCCYQSYKADHRAGYLMLPLLSVYTLTCWMKIRTYCRKRKEQ